MSYYAKFDFIKTSEQGVFDECVSLYTRRLKLEEIEKELFYESYVFNCEFVRLIVYQDGLFRLYFDKDGTYPLEQHSLVYSLEDLITMRLIIPSKTIL